MVALEVPWQRSGSIMGCTNSAPSTFNATSSKATDEKHDSRDTNAELDKEIAELTEMKKTQRENRVLPASDIVLTSVVDSSNQSTTTTASDVLIIDMESESAAFEAKPPEKIHTSDITVPSIEIQKEQTPDRHLPHPSEGTELEKVETIVEDLEGEETTTSEQPSEDTGQGVNIQDNDDSHLEQRATRWEALADVAAELPPKMTVDPLTGQIYSLSKRD